MVDGHVKWKTRVLIEVTIFSTYLLNWWCWTWQHIWFWKMVFINRTWLFLNMFLLVYIKINEISQKIFIFINYLLFVWLWCSSCVVETDIKLRLEEGSRDCSKAICLKLIWVKILYFCLINKSEEKLKIVQDLKHSLWKW